MTKAAYYIGLMSGTSADGIDLALVDFSQDKIQLLDKYYQAYNDETHQAITSLYLSGMNEIDRAFSLDVQLAHQFYDAIEKLLEQNNLSAEQIIAIGNHGQTIRHRPENKDLNLQVNNNAFTLQISCNQTLATLSSIRVVGQFRTKDIALGGQGAPLVPAFHQALFTPLKKNNTDIFVINIGGIANISFLPSTTNNKLVTGFDTGPGNALMDDWYQQHHQDCRYDESGRWAAQGRVNNSLLNYLLEDSYFHQPTPKSTGREVFHLAWLQQKLIKHSTTLSAVDIQATLAMLTATTICDEILKLSMSGAVYLCGGGVLNKYLCQLISQQLNQKAPDIKVLTTNDANIDSDALEAMAFAWFAYAFDHKIFGNIPAVTGATRATVLGVNYFP